MVEKIMDETNTGFMKHIGGLSLKKIDKHNFEFSVVVKESHLSRYGNGYSGSHDKQQEVRNYISRAKIYFCWSFKPSA